MSMRYAAILLVVVLAGCTDNSQTCETCSRSVSLAVYNRIEDSGMPWHTDLEVWTSGNYDPAYWRPQFDDEQHRIDAIRKWAKTLPPGCVRDDYNQWLDYYWELDLHEAEDEIRTHAMQKRMTAYTATTAADERAALALENDDDKIPVPPGAKQ